MVKMPNLDDLKKMGSGLIDSAKSVNVGGMIDKFKTGVESVSGKKGNVPLSDVGLRGMFEELNAAINELAQLQEAQANAVKKIQGSLGKLIVAIEANQNTTVETSVSHQVNTAAEKVNATTNAPQNVDSTSVTQQTNQSEEVKKL